MTIDFHLEEIQFDVSGEQIYNLISLWFETGLSFEQFDTIYQVGGLTESLDDSFIQSLKPPDTDFWRQMPLIINSMEVWEELPAWHEVCLLKRRFEACTDAKSFSQSFEPLLKRNLIIVTQLLPAIAKQASSIDNRSKHEPPIYDNIELVRLDQEPKWYQEKFYAYYQRRLENEIRLLRTDEISLRYIFSRQLNSISHFCSIPLLNFIEEHVYSQVEFDQQNVSSENEGVYPDEWLNMVNDWVLEQNKKPHNTEGSLITLNPDWVGKLCR